VKNILMSKFKLVIGYEQSGVFSKEKKAIILPIVIKGYQNDKRKHRESILERIVLVCGANYKVVHKDNEYIIVVECFKLSQLENIVPAIEQIYSSYDKEVKVEITNDCKEFFKQYC